MKEIIKKLIERIVKIDFFWKILRPISELGLFIFLMRKYHTNQMMAPNIPISFNSLVVQNGPFKGMKYPGFDSVWGSPYPKILGSYEKELWNIVEAFKKNNYSEIINIGCAEGYYAIGLGLSFPNTNIYAYDINEKARTECRKIAKLNNISENVIIRNKCTSENLKEFQFDSKGLIICDCEGFEKELFDNTNISNLTNCDLIIETHDFIDPEISKYIRELFQNTHTIESVISIDDMEKALTYNFDSISSLTLADRFNVVAEYRPSSMEWLICKSKINTQNT
ncbi:MAG: hypothetical protein KKA84_10115 [Bacteroidetes bacterium]|nr:hypothetical protein [Bacteroidota bacterium]